MVKQGLPRQEGTAGLGVHIPPGFPLEADRGRGSSNSNSSSSEAPSPASNGCSMVVCTTTGAYALVIIVCPVKEKEVYAVSHHDRSICTQKHSKDDCMSSQTVQVQLKCGAVPSSSDSIGGCHPDSVVSCLLRVPSGVLHVASDISGAPCVQPGDTWFWAEHHEDCHSYCAAF